MMFHRQIVMRNYFYDSPLRMAFTQYAGAELAFALFLISVGTALVAVRL